MYPGETAHTEFIICNDTIKGRKMIAWMGMAIDASTRLWMAGVVSTRRDRALADGLLQQVRVCCQSVHALLVCTDGWMDGTPTPRASCVRFEKK
jgi:hypothetical protein